MHVLSIVTRVQSKVVTTVVMAKLVNLQVGMQACYSPCTMAVIY